MSLLYSIIESPAHPNLEPLCRSLGIELLKLSSQRKAINALKRNPPDWVVAQFFYGFGNNYAGVNVSNLDVFLHSQRKYAPQARVVVLAGPTDLPHIDRLTELFDIHAVLPLPIDLQRLRQILQAG